MGEYSINIPASRAVTPFPSPDRPSPVRSEATPGFGPERAQGGAMPGQTAATALGDKLGLDALAKELERYVPKDFPAGRLQIDHDEDSGMFVYKTVDPATGEVLRQYPTDEMLRYISYHRSQEGLVVDDSV